MYTPLALPLQMPTIHAGNTCIRVLSMGISDLKRVARLLIRYYTMKDWEEFQIRYIWLTGLQNCWSSKSRLKWIWLDRLWQILTEFDRCEQFLTEWEKIRQNWTRLDKTKQDWTRLERIEEDLVGLKRTLIWPKIIK